MSTFVAIEGCMGAGKSSTVRALAALLGAATILEATDQHPFIGSFYVAPDRYAFETEVAFVLLHYHQLLDAPVSDPLLVTDFAPARDVSFAKRTLSQGDFDLFMRVHKRLFDSVRKPDFSIFLDPPLDILEQRIRKRGRDYEQLLDMSSISRVRDFLKEEFQSFAPVTRFLRLEGQESVEEVALTAASMIDAYEAKESDTNGK